MFPSIRWRIALPYALLILVTMAAAGAYISVFIRQSYFSILEAELAAESRLVADTLRNRLADGASPRDVGFLARRWSGLIGRRVTVIDPQGDVIGESHASAESMENHLHRPEIQQALQEGEGAATRFSATEGHEMMYTAIAIYQGEELAAFVRISRPLAPVEEDLRRLQRVLLTATLLATLLAIAMGAWIAGYTTRPLRRLTEAVGRISGGDLDAPIIPSTSDEVGQLTQAFNHMAVHLKSQIEALEAERSKLAAVLAEMSDGVIIVDRHGRVQLINPAAENMFAISRQTALNRSLAEVVRHHQLVEIWKSSQRSGLAQATTAGISARNLYLQAVATPFGHALPGSTLLLFQNLTRLRRLETVRRDFVSNISHELRTPLASLKALTETLLEGALDDPPVARRFLQRMETEVDSLSLMVAELLELSRIESGAVPMQMKPVHPAELVQEAVERLRLQTERSGLELQVQVDEDLDPILADPVRLEQVIANLLHNAIKFTPQGGRITIRAGRQAGQALITVSDTGVGIPPEDLHRIFERFFKSDRARGGGGTGLGLAIARHIVEAHGGKIWAESTPGHGSAFHFTIPFSSVD